MLDYEWGNPSGMMQLTGEEPEPSHHHHSDQSHHHTFMDPYSHQPQPQPLFSDHHQHQTHFLTHHHHDLSPTNTTSFFPNYTTTNQQQALQSLYDPRAFHGGASAYPSMLNLDGGGNGSQYMLVPKAEAEGSSRIGLNLGGRTYFASSEDDFVSRLYRRPRPMELGSAAANSPRCQAEGCNADLSHAKHYHRRHKVCEFHSKASTVIAAGLTQRFCQQCSRFHLLSEFDNGKRSCRKRLADHNRRRRKTQHQPNPETPKPISSSSEIAGTNPSSDHSVPRSPPDSGAQSSSSVTVALSPPRILSLDCFRQRTTYQNTPSSSSSGSLFFSSG